MPRRLRLEGETLEEIRDEARRRYGPGVKIVSAERIISGGIGGFFGKARYEVMVEVPTDKVKKQGDPVTFDLPARVGIAALLEDADDNDDVTLVTRRGSTLPTELSLSTGREDFNELLAGLVTDTTTTAPTTVPAPTTGPGDLVALVGLGSDAVSIARSMASHHDMGTAVAGLAGAAGMGRLASWRDATDARADGVRTGTATVVAVGVGMDAGQAAALLADLGPDQVWAVVDASRKPEDTARWVDRVRAVAAIEGLGVLGTRLTATPHTVNDLRLPVGWIEDAPAAAPSL